RTDRRYRAELCRRTARHRCRRGVGEPADGLWPHGLCGLAHADARHAGPRLYHRRRLRRGAGIRLADAGALPTWPDRRDFRPARTARAKTRASHLTFNTEIKIKEREPWK